MTYGLRGIAYYQIVVSGPGADLHSGIYGGSVYEPMTTLIAIMSKLVAPNGRILIPGVYDGVQAADSNELYVDHSHRTPPLSLTSQLLVEKSTMPWITQSQTLRVQLEVISRTPMTKLLSSWAR